MTRPAQSRQVLPIVDAAILVVVFWSGLAVFLFLRGISPAPPLYLLGATGALALPLLTRSGTVARVLRNPLSWWCLAYLIFSSLSILLNSQTDQVFQAFLNRVLAVICLFIVATVMSRPEARAATGPLMVAVGLIEVILVFIDLAMPLTFSAVIGRGAGLYINPNIAAAALLSAIVAASSVLPRWRDGVIVVLSLGVVGTLSRGGLVALAVVLVLLLVRKRIRLLPIVAAIVVCVVAAWATGLLDQALSTISASPLMNERLRGMMGGAESSMAGSFDDVSMAERMMAARASWALFLDHPLFGAGLGATSDWSLRVSTHNIFLRHLAEHGVLGLWIYPAFVAAVAAGAPKGSRFVAGTLLLMLGLVDHNVLEAWPILVWAGWMAAGGPVVAPNSRMPGRAPA